VKRPLRIPAVLACVVIGGVTALGLVDTSCGGDRPPIDASVADGSGSACELFCIPDGTDAGTVCDTCADAGNCPSGCQPIG
jgi:hypothetical protein